MAAWERIASILLEEFTDLHDIEELTRIGARLLLALVLGGLLGWEREQQGKAAGLRTHMLVCLGSTVLVLSANTAGAMDDPMSRVVQGIVAGIGFLGAGTIIKNQAPGDIRGLTTAASIWFTSAIGIAVGLGREAIAILSVLVGLVILQALPSMLWRNDKIPPD
ncbi:MgtC/SapB family protein [Kineobactrum salinum]|uniref:MgtC/SapB family protein n=1 Tax=Kineobactrum salinum TaxID=2708301 RepID=UPI001E4ECE68|nr:MgtC/SapB family protein [Kineobactrum salinum]